MSVFDIEPQWGSHADVLAAQLTKLEPGSLVIEHGAGMYSSTTIARFDVSVVCIEELQGWRTWARWLYEQAGRFMVPLDRAKPAIKHMADAALVFIDGATRERGDLLRWALDAKVPTIIAHDTESDCRGMYGYHEHRFSAPGYRVTSYGDRPQTTLWERP